MTKRDSGRSGGGVVTDPSIVRLLKIEMAKASGGLIALPAGSSQSFQKGEPSSGLPRPFGEIFWSDCS